MSDAEDLLSAAVGDNVAWCRAVCAARRLHPHIDRPPLREDPSCLPDHCGPGPFEAADLIARA